MDQQLIQRTRYVLHARVRRVRTCPTALFIPSCCQFINWLHNHPILGVLTVSLEKVSGDFQTDITKIMKDMQEIGKNPYSYTPEYYKANSIIEHAALCYTILCRITELPLSSNIDSEFALRIFSEYLTQTDQQIDDAIEAIRDVAIDGLFEYLDEQLDARNVLYALLLKYKQRCEWFHRERLRTICTNGLEGKTGERALALDLQEYVLDQGVEFVVEPSSVSGEVDLILRDSDGKYIILDAKFIPNNSTRSEVKEKVSSGFNQVARYVIDYNESSGFLVVFNNSSRKIGIGLDSSDGFNYLPLGGKSIYYLQIDIANLPSASKSGKADEVILTQDELVNSFLETT